MIYDDRGKIPRFVILKDRVINQREGGEEFYDPNQSGSYPWYAAYLKLYEQWRSL